MDKTIDLQMDTNYHIRNYNQGCERRRIRWPKTHANNLFFSLYVVDVYVVLVYFGYMKYLLVVLENILPNQWATVKAKQPIDCPTST